MSEIKSRLKEAKEAITKKEFEKSVEICKDVLRKDSKNYLALVFLGFSLQETGPAESSEKAFRKAIEINPTNLLAWNGLANFFEKINTTAAKLELIKIYTFLIGKETTEKKLLDYCDKLCNLYQYTEVEEICKVVYEKVENGDFSEETVIRNKTSLVNILNKTTDLSDDILCIYEDILSSLIASELTRTPEYFSQYLTILHKQKKYLNLLEYTIKMCDFYPNDCTALNWTCKIYNEFYIEDKTKFISNIDIDLSYKKLLSFEPENAIGLFSQSISCSKNNHLVEAREILKKVVFLRPGLLHAWVMLTYINLKLYLSFDAIESATRADKLLQSINNSNVILRQKTDFLLTEALSKSEDKEHWEQVIEWYENNEQEENAKNLCLPNVIRAHIQLGNITQAQKLLTYLNNFVTDNEIAWSLSSQLLRKGKHYKEALEILESNDVESSEWVLDIGITYYEANMLDKCLTPFLKSAKLNPNNFNSFIYLGHYYRDKNDLDKARRCYEKAYELCGSCSHIAIELSKIYRKYNNWEGNLALLKSIAKGTINPKNMWAWLQLGLTYIDAGDYQKAIDNLRLVLRVDAENSHCWEALADAYLHRGAYTSALKAFEKVLELTEDVMYPLLQIATIKKILGNFAESIKDFEMIMAKNKKDVLTLKGLAEVCFKAAQQCYGDQRLGKSRDYIQYAVDLVTLAIQESSEISCLWKLLADSCVFVANLPGKYCCLMIMRAVDEGKTVNGNKVLEQEDLFQLAARCYCKSILLIEDNVLIWHDLAHCYLSQALTVSDTDEKNSLLAKAFSIAQHCTMKNPIYWQHWNLLGNIVARKSPPNYALAQHAFIKAVTIDHNASMSWSNLGVIYLIKEHIKLANEAFSQAQRANPNYVNCWIGQALLAESLGHEDAMDLFRHSAQLGSHQQGALGYGHWVCRTLIGSTPDAVPYSISNMHAIPVACDNLIWYTEKDPYNCGAWNMLGILKERMGLMQGAKEAYKNALRLSTIKYSDLAKINYGRILTKLGEYKEANKVCSDVEESSFNSGIWYALALYKDSQYQEASSIYLAIAQYLVKDKYTLGDVVACMAIITYVMGEPEVAKKAIIESFTQRMPTTRVMYALIALGVLQKDEPLVQLTLKQVESLDDVTKNLQVFITLLSYVHILHGDYTKAIRKVSELVHLLPDKSSLWLTLSLTLLHSLNKSKSYIDTATASARSAYLAYKLREPKMTFKDIAKIMCTISISSLIIKNNKEAFLFAQKAVHCCPDARESWVVLIAASKMSSEKNTDRQKYKNVLDSQCETYRNIQINRIFCQSI